MVPSAMPVPVPIQYVRVEDVLHLQVVLRKSVLVPGDRRFVPRVPNDPVGGHILVQPVLFCRASSTTLDSHYLAFQP